MLTPEYLSECSNYILGQYDALNETISEDIARRIVKMGAITDTAEWQIMMAQQSGMLMDEVIESVARINSMSEADVEYLFEEAGIINLENDAAPLVSNGIEIEIALSPQSRQILEAAVAKTKGDLQNLTMTLGSTAQDLYLQACNQAYMEITSGAFTLEQSIRKAVKFAVKDDNFVFYSGSGTKAHLDVAVRRSLVTGVNQTCGKLTEMNAQMMHAEYFETTAHPGARPSHAAWQGRVFKINGGDAYYPNFVESTGYGTGDGLMGWNCRHSFHPFWPGISQRAYTFEQLQKYAAKDQEYEGEKYTVYELSQMQRAMERKIRATKRKLASYNASYKDPSASDMMKQMMKEEIDRESKKLKGQQEELSEFCETTGRTRDTFREQVHAIKDGTHIVAFDRSAASRASWAARKRA